MQSIVIRIIDSDNRIPLELAKELVAVISPLLGIHAEITVESVEKGSVILHARGNCSAAEGLIYQFCAGFLYPLGVRQMEITGLVPIDVDYALSWALEHLNRQNGVRFNLRAKGRRRLRGGVVRFVYVPKGYNKRNRRLDRLSDVAIHPPTVMNFKVTKSLTAKCSVDSLSEVRCKYLVKQPAEISYATGVD